MSGAAAAKELRAKKARSVRKNSAKTKGSSLLRKTRAQEIADIRNRAQKKALEHLQNVYAQFPLQESSSLPSFSQAHGMKSLGRGAIRPPQQQAHSDHNADIIKEGRDDIQNSEGKADATVKSENEMIQDDSKALDKEENESHLDNIDSTKKLELSESTNEEKTGLNNVSENSTDEKTTSATTIKEEQSDKSNTEADSLPTLSSENDEGRSNDDKTQIVDSDTMVVTEDSVSVTEPAETVDKEKEQGDKSVVESKIKDAEKTKEKKKKKKRKKGLMSSVMSMFSHKKKVEKKIWVAVPGALPSGKMDQQLWLELVDHFNTDIKNAKSSKTLSTPFWSHFNLAMCCDCRGDHVGAIRYYRDALSLRPDNIGLRYRLGVLLALAPAKENPLAADDYVRDSIDNTSIKQDAENISASSKQNEAEVHESDTTSVANVQAKRQSLAKDECVQHLMQVIEAQPRHSGALFELAAMQQDRQQYRSAIELLRHAIKGDETVEEALEKEFLGAPTISDAKATLAGALSCESYGADSLFDLKHISSESGAYDCDNPISIDKEKWQEAQNLFKTFDTDRHQLIYLPPIIDHVLGPAPDEQN